MLVFKKNIFLEFYKITISGFFPYKSQGIKKFEFWLLRGRESVKNRLHWQISGKNLFGMQSCFVNKIISLRKLFSKSYYKFIIQQ